jgi:tetratricopeptide (TPR) repeat protein
MDELRFAKEIKEDTIGSIMKRIENYGRLPHILGQLGAYYAESGDIAEAEKIIAELEVLVETTDLANAASSIALIMIQLDDKEKTLEWLERAFERRDPFLIEMNHITWFDELREDPRYKAIMRKIGLKSNQ